MSLEPLPLPTREELRALLKSALVPEAHDRLRLALGAGAVALRHLEAILLSLATHPGEVSARLSLAVDAATDLVGVVEKLKTRAAKLRR